MPSSAVYSPVQHHRTTTIGAGGGVGVMSPCSSTANTTAMTAVASADGPPFCLCSTLHDSIPMSAARYHDHALGPNQCCSAVVQVVNAPVPAVWSVVRRFDAPQSYKRFVKSCRIVGGDGRSVGTVREVRVVSGLPAATSLERLEVLDEERFVLSFRVLGGEHRLVNYRSVTTLHPMVEDEVGEPAGKEARTVVVESYVVDVPPGNTEEDTRVFVDTIVGCNLQSLARTAEKVGKKGMGTPAVV